MAGVTLVKHFVKLSERRGSCCWVGGFVVR